ncbi:CKLF-like MARVEL transmembrane domain-containing protein 8b [Chanos chanos]|uniref:CKLF-like MARVEL transmembrane domain-containing protein 8b n=1 Tax=Chanos chanos TaxID=29144 RepID=A0A6J2W2Y6_CHACN|nr:CKLF-like MARVEL transmembrane domain-containing protein 8 [Chanos chanos]
MEDDSEANRENTTDKTVNMETFSSPTLAYDRNFVRTVPGLLTFAELVFGLFVWTLVGGTEYLKVPALGWVMFVSVLYWVLTVFVFILYLTMAHTKISHVPWTAVGVIFNSSATVLYASAAVANMASVSQAIRGRYYYSSWIASTVFAFIVTLCYTGNMYFSYTSWMSKSEPQEQQDPNKN